MRRTLGVRDYSWQSPSGVRNILRDDPSILNGNKSAIEVIVVEVSPLYREAVLRT